MDPFRSPLALYYVQRDALRFPKFQMSDEDRQQIVVELPGASAASLTKLTVALEGTISFYKAWSGFEENHAPGGMLRRKLHRLAKTIRKLETAMRDLDWGTRRALAPFAAGQDRPSRHVLSARKPPEMTKLDDTLCRVHDYLAAIANAAERYLAWTTPRKGGPRRLSARQAFAVEIADALTECVPSAVKIHSTIGETFENVVAICLRAAGQDNPGDLHRIVLAAVKAYHADFRPRGLKTPPS